MALWPSPGDLFGIAARSRGALEEAVNYCLQKQACVQKVASSSPKTSWENVVMGLKTREELDSSPEQLILRNISAASNQLPQVTRGHFHAWLS